MPETISRTTVSVVGAEGPAHAVRAPRASSLEPVRCPSDIVVVRGAELALDFTGLGGSDGSSWVAGRSGVRATFALGSNSSFGGSHGALAFATDAEGVQVATHSLTVNLTSELPLEFSPRPGWTVTGPERQNGGYSTSFTVDPGLVVEVAATTPIHVVPAATSTRNAIPRTQFEVTVQPGAFEDGQRVLGAKHRIVATLNAELSVQCAAGDCYPDTIHHEDTFIFWAQTRSAKA